MLDSSEDSIGNRVMGMGGSGPSQFPFPFYLLPISDNTIICRLQTALSDVRVLSQSPAPGLTLGLRMLCFPILKELSVVEVTKDTGHSLRVP